MFPGSKNPEAFHLLFTENDTFSHLAAKFIYYFGREMRLFSSRGQNNKTHNTYMTIIITMSGSDPKSVKKVRKLRKRNRELVVFAMRKPETILVFAMRKPAKFLVFGKILMEKPVLPV